ncbi:hypothetical protein HYE67_008616 [Fusarium culmorum]|uniref:Uncharacterized protein n=1 Tax=Fusarium culmorum TaxID=5516 RepID=A0A7S8HZA7_FUSCU|nr:hypothetical protein HYE67_008616 [Fusarium culmorum]
MEPPTKKRRHGPSPPKAAQDEDDDDELASHPQEIKIRRDPDIQLALKRVNANQKLHATMAHIIEKYSRDFEGIGDEIDMATGEIVVNNGHLRNMRDEGDVEGLWVEGESNIDEDEGILLEDLTDEYSDNEEQANEIHHSQTDNENSQASSTKESDTETHRQDQNVIIDEASNNVSNIASSQNDAPHDETTVLPPGLPQDDSQLSPPSFGPGPPPGFGIPHPTFGPWGMMPGFPMQAWGRDDIPPYFNMPPSMPGPWFTGGRYDTASNNGQASIWGRKWTRKTKRAGSMKGSFKKVSDKRPSDAAVDVSSETPDNDRGSESKSAGGSPNKQEAPLSDQTTNASEEDEDFLCSGTSDATPIVQQKPSLVPSGDNALSKNHSSYDPPHETLEETNGNIGKVSQQPDENDDSGQRRSGRARKQTEYLGKISWDDAREFKRSGKTFTIQIHRADPSLREEYQSVDLANYETEGEVSLPSEQTRKGSRLIEEVGTKVTSEKLVVPDSQDTATSFNSSAPQAAKSKNVEEPSSLIQTMIPTMELSDDEAPLALSRIRVPKRQIAAPVAVSPASGLLTEQDERSTEPANATSAPLKSNNEPSPEAEITVDVVDGTMQLLKRKRGRPKGSTSAAKATPSKTPVPVRTKEIEPMSPTCVVVSLADHLPQSTKRKRGRPRKSVGAISTVQDEENNPTKELANVDDGVSESDHQGPVNEISSNEVSGKPPPLSNDLKWLLKTKPKDSTTDRACDTFLYKFVHPRKPKEILQQAKDDEPGSQVTQETKEVPKDIEDDLKEQTILYKPQAPMQEADTSMEDVTETREDSESGQHDQTSPSSSSPPYHGDGTPGDDESPEVDEPIEYGTPIPHIISDDEAIESEGSLPPLPQGALIQEASTPRKPKQMRSSFIEPPSSSQKPRTPRHKSIRTNRAPSSRRSLLSFVSDSESDNEGSRDELTRRVKSHSKSASVRPSSRKIRRPATLTRKIYRTPSKKRVHEISSPIGTIKTPGGTIKICSVDGHHCGRDYCFTCI